MGPKLMAIQDLRDMLEGELNESVKPKAISVKQVTMKPLSEQKASDEQLLKSQHGDDLPKGLRFGPVDEETFNGGKEETEELSEEDIQGLEELLKKVLK